MENAQIDIIKSISNMKARDIYQGLDSKWYINSNSFVSFYDTKEEAEKEVEDRLSIDILQMVADGLDLGYGYGFDGKKLIITIE